MAGRVGGDETVNNDFCTHYALFYGSLRRDSSRNHNFQRFGPDTQRYVTTIRLPGMALFEVCPEYPAACFLPDGNLEIEVHTVRQQAWMRISWMEDSAGYILHETNFDGSVAYIWLWPPERVKARGLRRIPDDCWL